MNFGTKQERWSHVELAISPLFENLLKAVNYLRNRATQIHSVTSGTIKDAGDLLKLLVMIFSRIFQRFYFYFFQTIITVILVEKFH